VWSGCSLSYKYFHNSARGQCREEGCTLLDNSPTALQLPVTPRWVGAKELTLPCSSNLQGHRAGAEQGTLASQPCGRNCMKLKFFAHHEESCGEVRLAQEIRESHHTGSLACELLCWGGLVLGSIVRECRDAQTSVMHSSCSRDLGKRGEARLMPWGHAAARAEREKGLPKRECRAANRQFPAHCLARRGLSFFPAEAVADVEC
jgi:hypothetical protein